MGGFQFDHPPTPPGPGSKVLYWDDEERGDWGPGILRLEKHGMLVFGGDAPDKGPGDIRLVKILLSLKNLGFKEDVKARPLGR